MATGPGWLNGLPANMLRQEFLVVDQTELVSGLPSRMGREATMRQQFLVRPNPANKKLTFYGCHGWSQDKMSQVCA